jgi:SAM-dependent methyltransferase
MTVVEEPGAELRQASLPAVKVDMGSDARTLLIVFGGVTGWLEVPRFDFLRVVRGIPVKWIVVRDLQQAWYHRGIPGHGATIAETADALSSLIARHDVERVVTMGASAGGYAALLFGALLDAEQALCFAPQTVLDLDVLARMGDHRWERHLASLAAEDALDEQWTDLLGVLGSAPAATRCHVYFDDSFHPDRAHAERLRALECVRLYRFGAGRHQIGRLLAKTGVLAPLLRRAVQAPPSEAEVTPEAGVWRRGPHDLLNTHFTSLYAFFKRFVPEDTSRLTLLDFGCGPTGYVNLYSKHFGRCLALDIVDCAGDYHRDEIEFVLSNGRDIPLPDRSVDVVTAHSVLEHVEGIEFTLGELSRVLVEGGYAYLTVSPLYYSPAGGHLRVPGGGPRLSEWEHLDPDSPYYMGVDPADAFVGGLNRINKLTSERFLAAVGRQPWDIVTYRIAAESEKPLPSFLRGGDVSRVDLFTKSFRLIARKRFSVVDDEVIEAPPAVG